MFNNINLQNEIISRIKPVISSWTDDDIYAVSLFVYDRDDNPCEPTFTLGFNTERFYEREVSRGFSDEEEARWNYACWLQNAELIFGEGDTEEIVKQWISGKDIDEENPERITGEFVSVLVEAVKELHKSGFIKEKFGKAIPVIIHELEYYDKIAVQNIEANTLPLVQGLADFCGYTL